MKTFDDLEKEGNFQEALRQYKFPEPGFKRYESLIYVIAVITVTLAVWFVFRFCLKPNGIEIATVVLTLGALLIAYQQWRAARYEASMDKYYERLDVANRRLENLKGIYPYVMYVFTEPDNLEYVIEKYKLGYIYQ